MKFYFEYRRFSTSIELTPAIVIAIINLIIDWLSR